MCYHHFCRACRVLEMVPILLMVLYSILDAIVHRLFLPPILHRPPFSFHGFFELQQRSFPLDNPYSASLRCGHFSSVISRACG
jgi:hypothetical protein